VKPIVLLAALTLLASDVFGGDSATNTFYVQLIRGTDTAQPPQPGAHRAGPKLTKTFEPVFKWKYYWELNVLETSLRPGEKARVRLSPEREVEIDLTQPKERRVTAFQDGKVADRMISPVGESRTIIGGSREPKSAWFIVVRRDKPQAHLADN
jgi:hypothetical protein